MGAASGQAEGVRMNAALPYLTLALACIALAVAIFGWLNLRNAIDALPKPFWMGAWPPAPGSIIDGAYRYDHLPQDGMDEQVLRTVLMISNPGNQVELVAQAPEKKLAIVAISDEMVDEALRTFYEDFGFYFPAYSQLSKDAMRAALASASRAAMKEVGA